MKLAIDAKIICTDGETGHLSRIILNPVSDEVTHIVAKWNRQEYELPVTHVVHSSQKQIELNCTREFLKKQPTFVETEYIRVPEEHREYLPNYSYFRPYVTMETTTVKHEHVPNGELAIKRGMKVFVKDEDDAIGRIDELVVAQKNHRITHIVLREGHLWDEKKDVVISVEHIKDIDEDGIYLRMTKAQVDKLPTMPVKRQFWS
jgi:sporulation protein YlmC with PRC-barrel domain